jgi:hypothetical protein
MSTTKDAIERFSPLERGCYVEGGKFCQKYCTLFETIFNISMHF